MEETSRSQGMYVFSSPVPYEDMTLKELHFIKSVEKYLDRRLSLLKNPNSSPLTKLPLAPYLTSNFGNLASIETLGMGIVCLSPRTLSINQSVVNLTSSPPAKFSLGFFFSLLYRRI